MDTQVSLKKWLIPILAVVVYMLFIACGCAENPPRVYKVAYSISDMAQRKAVLGRDQGPDNLGFGVGQEGLVGGGASGPTEPILPMSGYHIGPGDVLDIRIYQLLELEREEVLLAEVDRRGEIYLPLLNHVYVAGMTCKQLRDELTLRLGQEFIRDPQVAVSVHDYRSKKVMVLGAVKRPGELTLESDCALLMDVISLAQGISGDAAPDIEILRGAYNPGQGENQEVTKAGSWLGGTVRPYYDREIVPISKLYAEQGEQINPWIYPGDVVKVLPGTEGKVYVSGEVKQPGAKPFRRPLTILQAVSTAGGTTGIAEEKQCQIIRRTAEGGEKVIMVNLEKIRKGKEQNLLLACDDTIVLPVDPVKKFFSDLDNLFRRGVYTGVEVTYDAGSEMGIPSAGGVR